MQITPRTPDGYNGPLKQFTCQICKRPFYLPWADYKRLKEVFYCHDCSLLEHDVSKSSLIWNEQGEKAGASGSSRLLWTIPQVMEALQFGRSTVYTLIAREGLPTIRFGRSVRLSPEALRKWLAQREHQK
jgi:excisionase family DNA binding protein